MKIAIIGYSGAGKSTLAKLLAEHYSIPVLFLDCVGWKSGWEMRDKGEASEMIHAFLDTNDDWVIEGNWMQYDKGRRFQEADKVIFLNFPRRCCLSQALKRYWTHRGSVREDIAEGCPEKFDLDFAWWILAKGRDKIRVERYQRIADQTSEKFYELKNPRDVKTLKRTLGLSKKEST